MKSERESLLSVCMITYNHENYIAQAIEGVLMQKTNFDFELVIGEDNSKDETRKICVDYKTKHPQRIKLLENDKNLGMMPNFLQTLNSCHSKYIAICEGDDYWTDPYKLQKQVDFLEANPDFAICFHNADVYNEIDQKVLYQQPGNIENIIYKLNDFLASNPVATASVVFNKKYIEYLPEWFSQAPFGDLALYIHILFQSKKNAVCLKDNMAVYRIHMGGIHGGYHFSNKKHIMIYKQHIKFWNLIYKNLRIPEYSHVKNQTYIMTYNKLRQLLFREKKIISVIFYSICIMILQVEKVLNKNHE